MDGRSDGNPFFKTPKMSSFLYGNHQGSPTSTIFSTLLNVLGVLGVLNVLDMPLDPSLACWAYFFFGTAGPAYCYIVFRCVLTFLSEGLSIGPLVGWSVGLSVRFPFSYISLLFNPSCSGLLL